MPDHPNHFADILDEFRKTLRQAGGASASTATIASGLEGIIEKSCPLLEMNADGLGLLRAAEKIRDAVFPESILSGSSLEYRHFESLSRETIRSRVLAIILSSANGTELEAPANLVFEWLGSAGRLPAQVLEY